MPMLRVAIIALGFSSLPATASAQPAIERARAAYEDTRFEDAVAVLEDLEREGELDRDGLVELYALRGLVHAALGNSAAVDADLLALASLDPGRAVPTTWPPSWRSAFEEARARTDGQRIAVDVDAEALGETARLAARAEADPAGLARSFRIFTRPAGADAYRRHDGSPTTVPAPEEGLEYYAELVGPAGAVLATTGSADRPRRLRRLAERTGMASEPDGPPWLWLGLGALVLTAAAVVAGALLLPEDGDPNTRFVGGPVVADR